MSDLSRRISLLLFFFFFFIPFSLQFLSGFSDEQKDTKAESKSKKGSTIFIVCVGLAAIAGLSSYLFKLWQKKKRDEQHARLLKLFEDDDELEFELGFSD